MGFAFGENNNGREIGYGVEAVCDLEGCGRKIDHGVYFCCGGTEGIQNADMEDEPYCGGFFCGEHLLFGAWCEDGAPDPVEESICPTCAEDWEKAHPEEAA